MTPLLALALLALQQQESHGLEPHGPGPGPRAAVAGISGLQVISKLDFGDGQSNRLTAAYVFPDRTRWHFENYSAKTVSDHLLFYRSGERAWQFEQGKSTAMEGAALDMVLLQMELRRAVLLWPDGFQWSAGEAGGREAEVSADSCCGKRPVGTLVATLEELRPVRMEARDSRGNPLEAIEIRAWQELAGRAWPRTLELMGADGRPQFLETVEAIETRVRFLEVSFLPPDLRPIRNASTNPSVQAMDLVASTHAAHPLPKDIDWPEAEKLARTWIAEARAVLGPNGPEVDPTPTFLLSDAGRPSECLVRLVRRVDPPPPGFESTPEGVALVTGLAGLSSVTEGSLQRLRSNTPEGFQPGRAYIRMHARPDLPIELVLPLESSD